MKSRSLSLLALPALAFVLVSASALPLIASDAFQQNTRLGRGVNILGWDALWQNRARGQFKEAHFKMIREAGFQHVRINLHPLRDGKPDANGRLREGFIQTMDWAVDQALTNQLLVILDFHDDLAISPDPAGKRKEFLNAYHVIVRDNLSGNEIEMESASRALRRQRCCQRPAHASDTPRLDPLICSL